MGLFQSLLSSDFTPHGFCYRWDPRIVWLHVISDALITLSYYCIPIILIYFILRKNRDLPFSKIFWMFGTFILACGTTHLMEIWNIWHASYLLSGVIKAITAAVSVLTAAMLVPLIPKVMSLPERAHLQEVNRGLEREIAAARQFDAPVESALRRRVNGGFAFAMLLTLAIGFSSWSSARLAANDADWAAHTYIVMDALELLSKHVIETQTSARAFALSGEPLLLTRYATARAAIAQDEQALRRLTADNPVQQQQLDVLGPQIGAAIVFGEKIIAQRKGRQFPGGAAALEIERLTDRVRATAGEMRSEEIRLLAARARKAETHRQFTRLTSIAGVFVGTFLWVLARLAVNREIDVGARAQTQVNRLNARLEQRVEERTAALQLEIMERSRAEEALRESEERFQAMVNGIPQLAWMAEADGHIFWYNQRWYDYTGTTFEQMQGWGWQSVHDPKVLPRVLEGWKRAIAAGQPFEMEFPLRAASGRFGTFLTRIVPARDSTGLVTRWFGTNTDISELKHVEEVLHEQSRVLDLAQVLVRDMDGRIVLWNSGVEKLYGFPREEAVGQLAHQLLRTEFPAALAGIEEHLQRTGAWEGELAHRKRDGEPIVVSSIWVLHRDANGQPTRILEASVDITARKQAEERLARQAEEVSRQAEELIRSRHELQTKTLMLQSVLDGMAEGLIAADHEGHFLIWNDAAKKLMGRDASDLPAEQWTPHYKVFRPDGITPYPTDELPLVRALRGESANVELVVQHPETLELRFMEVAARSMRDAQGTLCGGVAVLHDITQRKENEREIRKLNDELEHRVADRTAQLETANKELEAFSYSVSHDLRAPLRHIGGFSKILIEEFGPSLAPGAQHYLHRIQAGTQKMGLLVDELLNLAKVGRQALKQQATPMNALVAEVLEILQPETAGRQVEWIISDLPPVDCDPVLVKQVFQNLLTNALKFTRPRAQAVIEVTHQQDGGQTAFLVRDNGIGFNMKYFDKLFGVFQRLHRAEDFEGTGIGLATVQRIVQKHGGRVWAEGEVDKGATFYFTLGGAAGGDARRSPSLKHNGATAGGRS